MLLAPTHPLIHEGALSAAFLAVTEPLLKVGAGPLITVSRGALSVSGHLNDVAPHALWDAYNKGLPGTRLALHHRYAVFVAAVQLTEKEARGPQESSALDFSTICLLCGHTGSDWSCVTATYLQPRLAECVQAVKLATDASAVDAALIRLEQGQLLGVRAPTLG